MAERTGDEESTPEMPMAKVRKAGKPMLSVCCKVLRYVGIGLLTLIVICGMVFFTQVLRNSNGNGTLQDLSALPDTNLRIATYNVHYIGRRRESGLGSVNAWEERKGALNEAFGAIQADIVGFQEMETYGPRGSTTPVSNLALDWLLEYNTDYGAAAQGDPDVFPSTQPIFYRLDRFTLLDEGWYFFSNTPDVIYSRTFDGSWAAFASWAQFLDNSTGVTFRVVNIHTDYSSGSNRIQSADLVAERTKPWISAGETVFMLGDFNAMSGSPTLRAIETIGIDFHSATGSTFHFNRGLNLFGAIDHIGHAGDAFEAEATTVVRRKFDGKWPTDHYPVLVDFQLNDS